MKLYYSPGASSLACHIAICEAGLVGIELVRVDLEKHQVVATGEDFLAVNPMGKVPVLVLDDGHVLTEGSAVLQYLADRAPHAHLAPVAGSFARHRLTEALSFVATELHKGFSPMFDPDLPADYRRKLLSDPRPMNGMARLVAEGPYVLGAEFSVADAYLISILRLGRHAGLDYSPWPAVEAYFARVVARPAVRAALRAEGLVDP